MVEGKGKKWNRTKSPALLIKSSEGITLAKVISEMWYKITLENSEAEASSIPKKKSGEILME